MAYDEIVHWKKKFFPIPLGSAGKKLTSELATLFRAFGEASGMECVALKAAMVLPALLLQRTNKPNKKTKSRDHRACLERRMVAWRKGNIKELVSELRFVVQRNVLVHLEMETQKMTADVSQTS